MTRVEQITKRTVRKAAEQTLQTWLPWTLAQTCLSQGLDFGHVPAPTADAYHELHDSGLLPRLDPRTTVTVATVVPDVAYTHDRYQLDDDWFVQTGRFTLVVNVACRGTDHGNTVDRMDLYTAAVETVLTQHTGLGAHPFDPGSDLATSLRLTGSTYEPVEGQARMWLQGLVVADVVVAGIRPEHAGIDSPPDDLDDPADAPTALTVTTTITHEES